MKKLADVQSAYDVAKLMVLIIMIAVIVTEALTLITGIVMLAFPQAQEPDYQANLGNTLSTILFGISSIILLIMTHRYFKDAVVAGTPFTVAGAAQIKTLGITCMVSQGVALLGSYAIDMYVAMVPEARLTNYLGVVLGAILFLASKVLDYGAALEEKNQQLKDRIAQLQLKGE